MSKRDVRLFLDDIREAINKIRRYVRGMGCKDFCRDIKTIDAVIRNFEVIGEAAKNVPKDFRDLHPQLPWRKMMSLRNKVAHEYFGIDNDILWKTIEEELPLLRKEVLKLLKELS